MFRHVDWTVMWGMQWCNMPACAAWYVTFGVHLWTIVLNPFPLAIAVVFAKAGHYVLKYHAEP